VVYIPERFCAETGKTQDGFGDTLGGIPADGDNSSASRPVYGWMADAATAATGGRASRYRTDLGRAAAALEVVQAVAIGRASASGLRPLRGQRRSRLNGGTRLSSETSCGRLCTGDTAWVLRISPGLRCLESSRVLTVVHAAPTATVDHCNGSPRIPDPQGQIKPGVLAYLDVYTFVGRRFKPGRLNGHTVYARTQ
jgi:hypothetical protein